MMASALKQFYILLWKNFAIRKGHKLKNLCEILVPVVCCLLLALVRSLYPPEKMPVTVYPPFKIRISVRKHFKYLAWSPWNPTLRYIMEDIADSFTRSVGRVIEYRAFENSETLTTYLENEINMNDTLAGIQFDDVLRNATSLPLVLNITLRFPGELRFYSNLGNLWDEGVDERKKRFSWQTHRLFPVLRQAGPRSWNNTEGANPSCPYRFFPKTNVTFSGYHEEGFLKLQYEISLALIRHYQKRVNKRFSKELRIVMQRFPYPEWYTDDYTRMFLPPAIIMFTMFAFIIPYLSLIVDVSLEKEKQLKENLKILGVSSVLQWLAWFVKCFVTLFIGVSIATFIFKIRWYPNKHIAIFTHSNWRVILLFLSLYSCAVIASAFAITAFFSRAAIALLVGSSWWLVPFVTFRNPATIDLNRNIGTLLLLGLPPTIGLTHGLYIITLYEIVYQGIQWHNLWKPPPSVDNLTLGHLMLMLVFDTVLYMLITLYAEQVVPLEYGVARPWYFLFTKSFWCGPSKTTNEEVYEEAVLDNKFYEKGPRNVSPGITLLHLRKQYPKYVVAVEDLTLNMYEDQITVLLGRNGAGKTTTLSMLCGMTPPTSGTAIIKGHDIRTDMKRVRESFGYCPEHGILFDDLTVKQHLYFYSALRGLSRKQIKAETTKYLEEVNLTSKKNELARKLPDEMKRKLSACLALCGDSRVVMFDEPSLGIDPAARRDLWDLLVKQKKSVYMHFSHSQVDRTILLTTQSIEEADAVGDRIAILANGKLKCYGSNFFLKKKYKAGYHLTVELGPDCNVKDVTRVLQRHIPDTQLDSETNTEAMYLLPKVHSPYFEEMLGDLEFCAKELNVLHIGISFSTLELVFMKATTDQRLDTTKSTIDQQISERPRRLSRSLSFADCEISVYSEKEHCCCLCINQIIAMFMKKFKLCSRSWTVMLFVLCILLFYLILPALQTPQSLEDLPKLKISLDAYKNPVTPLTHYSNVLSKYYIAFLTNNKYKYIDWGNGNFSRIILKETEKHESGIKERYIVGASILDNTIVAWFNNEPLHSPPLTLQLVTNTILKVMVSENHTFQFYNHPLPFISKTKHADLLKSSTFLSAFQVTLTMCLVGHLFLIFSVRDQLGKIKHLEFTSGAGIATYWVVSLVVDFIIYGLISICVTLIIFALPNDRFQSYAELKRFYCLLLCFGGAVLPVNYLATYIYSAPMRGFFYTSIFHAATSIVIVSSLLVIKQYGLKDTLHQVFILLPAYALMSGVMDLDSACLIKTTCDNMLHNCNNFHMQFNLHRYTSEQCKQLVCNTQPKCCSVHGYYDWERPGIAKQSAILPAEGLGCMLILLLIEYRWFRICKGHTKASNQRLPSGEDEEEEDEDVQQERKKVQEIYPMQRKNYPIIMKDLSKYYMRRTAVDKLTVCIQTFECFGLLGYTGAGKTTIFKMLTGDTTISSGDIWINGLSIKSHLLETYQDIGYCPEQDALPDKLTCREILGIFCLYRGIPRGECKRVVDALANAFGLQETLDKYFKNLNSGNRRKVSTAVALAGDPPILYLDEPTKGLDPSSKRLVWNVLRRTRDKGKCIILNSHSVEECEALCTRLAIMVNGRFMCLGSIQHLKNKFTSGYALTIKIRKRGIMKENLKQIRLYVKEHFPHATIRNRLSDLVTFNLGQTNKTCSKMFGIIERGKETLNIEDYYLGQNTLEQVFVSFRKRQREEPIVTETGMEPENLGNYGFYTF